MFAVAFLGFLAVFHQAASSTQTPQITQCPGITNPVVQIENITITDAELGKSPKFEGTAILTQEVDDNPVLKISLYGSDGQKLPCLPSVLPCTLKLCNGTTEIEQTLNQGWGNTCPVAPGTYSALLTFDLPDNDLAKLYFGDGNVNVKIEVEDDNDVLECLTYPLQVKLN
ncbi:uncharacterized protein LOC144105540 [Amblyomma americanum]